MYFDKDLNARSKFAPKSIPSVFLGYPHNQKGYKLLDMQTGSLYVSRDVLFYVNDFPFLKIGQPSPSLFNSAPFVDDQGSLSLSRAYNAENERDFVDVNVHILSDDNLRVSTKTIKAPFWQKDFILTNSISTCHPLSNILSLNVCSAVTNILSALY